MTNPAVEKTETKLAAIIDLQPESSMRLLSHDESTLLTTAGLARPKDARSLKQSVTERTAEFRRDLIGRAVGRVDRGTPRSFVDDSPEGLHRAREREAVGQVIQDEQASTLTPLSEQLPVVEWIERVGNRDSVDFRRLQCAGSGCRRKKMSRTDRPFAIRQRREDALADAPISAQNERPALLFTADAEFVSHDLRNFGPVTPPNAVRPLPNRRWF